MEFVEQMGGYFELNGLTRRSRPTARLAAGLPARATVPEDLAAALDASSGGISTNARTLIQFGYIERLALAGDRRTYYRLRPNAFAAGERQRIRTMSDLAVMAEAGMRALEDRRRRTPADFRRCTRCCPTCRPPSSRHWIALGRPTTRRAVGDPHSGSGCGSRCC